MIYIMGGMNGRNNWKSFFCLFCYCSNKQQNKQKKLVGNEIAVVCPDKLKKNFKQNVFALRGGVRGRYATYSGDEREVGKRKKKREQNFGEYQGEKG